jgi:AraC-like DNA-binding protein
MVGGAELLRHNGASHVASVGTVIAINPGEWHANGAAAASNGFAYRMLYPPADRMRSVASELAGREVDAPGLIQPIVTGDATLSRLLLDLHLALEQGAPPLEQDARFAEFTACLLSRYARVRPDVAAPLGCERRYVRRVREYLEAHCADGVSLAELSTVADVSPFHLLRMFRDEVGLPPHEYQTHVRVERVKRLLRDGWTVARAASEVGFVDQSHLTRHFKRIVGLTPGQFRPDRKGVQDGNPSPAIQ